ncbi:sigma-54-dependent Fis family transcriptional regulator [Haliangium ochraceum]|uniref:GAF modulated sigma54 specific transcriptional regulator, Fis family n=1 Tax=Haliangium ochraceum (strain DSM 14365 / JCM 11303 / SMP-2) TaxID=502025 RepID=D0LRM2_HALO1|nr:sigma 54-interacting transcriptional regulator [Haliangium ochraceum]ACY19014.1 GAF modulated sigma54 specific transcriptional regulator, Fis family [Haliangium ochraceum DSM 14365]
MSDPLILPPAPSSLWLDFHAKRARLSRGTAVLEHWQRARELGALHDGPRPEDALDRGGLSERIERVEPVLIGGRGIIERVSAVAAGHDYTLLVADESGVVVRSGGGFREQAQRAQLLAGADWSERQRGTNAIGTVLAEERPVFVHGGAHYARNYHGLVCYGAPVRDADGTLVAVIDATSSVERANPAVGFGVIAAAQALEEVLRVRAYSLAGATVTRALARSLERMSCPVALVEPPDRISRVNAAARQLFGGGGAQLDLATLLGVDFDTLAEFDGDPVELRAGDRRQTLRVRVEPIESGGRAIALLCFFEPVQGQAQPAPARPRAPRPAPAETPFSALFAEDAATRQALAWAERIAPSDLPVMLLAETGAGKELVANGIHRASARASGPFLAVNCGSIADSLLESELFGYAPHAFTGAERGGRSGYFEAASGGTLFLDEVAEMPLAMQAALLRVLETGSYRRVGEVQQRHADVRVLCATCRDLPSLVEHGQFRSDLYFRLKGVTVTLPPLRARSDLLSLAHHLLAQAAMRSGQAPAPRLSPAAQELLRGHTWPGNVRELKSALEVALVLAGDAIEIAPEHLPPELRSLDAAPAPADDPGEESLADVQGRLVRRVLGEVAGNVSLAAKRLGVARSTLYRMMRRHGVDADDT